MPVSRYPRPGQRLAPLALRELLGVQVPPGLLGNAHTKPISFAELDESAWRRFGPDVCRRLADALVELVRVAILTLPRALKSRPLPRLPRGTTLESLDLGTRTYNCLSKMQGEGLLEDAPDLRNKTFSQILDLEGFGAKSFVDLLASMEEAGAEGPGAGSAGAGSAGAGSAGAGSAGAGSAGAGSAGAAAGRPEPLPRVIAPWEYSSRRIPLAMLRYARIPKLPAGATLFDLRLEARTLQCLEVQGFHERLGDLEECTFADLLAIPGFRTRCLYDLLRALDVARSVGPGESSEAPSEEESSAAGDATLEEELRALVRRAAHVRRADSPTDRNACIAIRYFGFDGSGGTTLKEVGDEYGLTRERVRQICFRVTRAVRRGGPAAPRLDGALAAVAEQLPAEATTIEKTLQAAGITATRFRLEGLAQAAHLLGRKVPFAVEDVDGRRMALRPERGQSTKPAFIIT